MADRIPADMDAFLREHAARATPLPEVREAALARWPHAVGATDEQRRTHETRIETAYKHRRKRAREEARSALAESVSEVVRIDTAHPSLTVSEIGEPASIEPKYASRITRRIEEPAADAQSDGSREANESDPNGTFEDEIEAAYWNFDNQRKRGTEKDAFKGQTRRLISMAELAAESATWREAQRLLGEEIGMRCDFRGQVGREYFTEMCVEANARPIKSATPDQATATVDNMAAQVGRLADAVSQMLAQAADVAAAKDALIETQKRYIEHLQRMVGA